MCLGQTLSQPEGKESKAQKGKKCIQGPKLISGDGTLCQAFGLLYPIAVLANQNQDPGSLQWLSRSHRAEFLPGDLCLLGRWHLLELWQVVTHVAASTLSPQPTVHTFKQLGQQQFIRSSSSSLIARVPASRSSCRAV